MVGRTKQLHEIAWKRRVEVRFQSDSVAYIFSQPHKLRPCLCRWVETAAVFCFLFFEILYHMVSSKWYKPSNCPNRCLSVVTWCISSYHTALMNSHPCWVKVSWLPRRVEVGPGHFFFCLFLSLLCWESHFLNPCSFSPLFTACVVFICFNDQ